MKKLLRILGILILVIILGAGIFAAKIYFSPIPSYKVELPEDFKVTSDSASIARGKKLVLTLCNNCHGRGKSQLSGGHMPDIPMFGDIYAPNITQHPEHGKISKYSDAEIAHLLRTGIKRDGQYAPPYMPKLPLLSDNDLNAIISFLRSDDPMVQPSDEVQPEPKPSFLTKFLCTVAMKPYEYRSGIPDPDPNDKVALGKYLSLGVAACFECHSADFKTNNSLEPEKSPGFFGGGNKMMNLDGEIVLSKNITMHPENGIGSWTEEDFVKALRFGQRPNGGEPLKYPMEPYNHLTDDEARAIWAYLQTVPVLDNKVGG